MMGVIAGRNDDVLAALHILMTEGPPLGMDLNMIKKEIVKFTLVPDAFPAEFKRFYWNFELLGSPIGDAKHCTEFIIKYVDKRVVHAKDALILIRDAQVCHFLLRLCCSYCM